MRSGLAGRSGPRPMPGRTPPRLPAAALVRTLLEGRSFPPGATTSAGLLPLDALLRELAAFPIRTATEEGQPEHPALFPRLLGRRFATLPPAVRTIHAGLDAETFTGRAVTRAGRGVIARAVRAILGLPPSGHCAVQVRIVPNRSGETWTRRFGSSQFASRLTDTARLGVFEERFGLLRFAFRLQTKPGGVLWRIVGWNVAGMPLPLALAPRMHAGGDEVDGHYRFRVAVAHPWTGHLFAYRGDLRRAPAGEA